MQALALHDAGIEGGLFAPMGVGEGKTLTTLLLPLVLGAKRPLLLLPATLIENYQRERLRLSAHWKIPTSTRVFSYELLGRVQSEGELETYAPDAIICDEVHKLKNKRAACTRRVARYMHAHPLTKFCGLSGSIMDKSLEDFAHILLWALKLRAPVPIKVEEIREWADALAEGWNFQPGALFEFCTPEERRTPRLGFRRRLTETPGVVATVGVGEQVNASIYIRGIVHKVSTVTESNFVKLRQWKLPDDWQIDYAVDVWRHAQELALGLHYEWRPRPPPEWLAARKAWQKFVREVISHGRTFDSELHVANAVDAGRLEDWGVLGAWRAVRDTFVPNTVAVWHDDSALKTCAEWMRSPGVVWTEHGFFAEALSKMTGHAYFGARGFDATGRYIEDAKPTEAVVASIDANREGKNLQTIWHRTMLVCPPASGTWAEQVLGRFHRPGQTADVVEVDVLLGCRENYDACVTALERARAITETTGKTQKLLLADVLLPHEEEIDALGTDRWRR